MYVGTTYTDYRRDLSSWVGMDRDGFTERLVFNVFKFQEPGLIKIYVVESSSMPRRVMVRREPGVTEGWKTRHEFYAYGSPRPGTNMIWVAYRGDPDRCIFLKGDREDTLEGWERRLEFWVPK